MGKIDRSIWVSSRSTSLDGRVQPSLYRNFRFDQNLPLSVLINLNFTTKTIATRS